MLGKRERLTWGEAAVTEILPGGVPRENENMVYYNCCGKRARVKVLVVLDPEPVKVIVL